MARGRLLHAILTDGLDRAAFHGFAALGEFIVIDRLLINVRISLVLGAGKVIRRSLAAEIAVNALAVHIELACHVFDIFVFAVSHGE